MLLPKGLIGRYTAKAVSVMNINAGRKGLNVFLTGAIIVSSIGVGLLIDAYTKEQSRTPQALVASTGSNAPAADAVSTGKAATIPSSQQAKLDADRQAATEGKKPNPEHIKKLDEFRSAKDQAWLNVDGSHSLVHHEQDINYQDASGWHDIDNKLVQDATGAWQNKDNSWKARFGKINTDGVQILKDGQAFRLKPVGANSVVPIVTGTAPNEILTYRNVWQGVDLQYAVTGSEIKETIVVKSRVAASTFKFTVSGANLTADPSAKGSFKLDGAFADFKIATPSVGTFKQGVISSQPLVDQNVSGDQVTVTLDRDWLQDRSVDEFPITIDPTVTKWSAQGNWYRNFKSDGYICDPGMGCGNSAGNASNQYWRFAYHVEFPSDILGTYVTSASLYLEMPNADGVHYYGQYGGRIVYVNHAGCLNSFNCIDGSYGTTYAVIGSSGNIDVSPQYRRAVDGSDTGNWMMVSGEEVPNYETFKMFSYDRTAVTFNYDYLPNQSTIAAGAPADGGVSVNTQPVIKSSIATDPDNSGPVQYRYTIGTSKIGGGGGTSSSIGGITLDSGYLASPTWTALDNVLQDGTTYYWQVQTWDSVAGAYNKFSPVYSFKVDLRNGKDQTQAYDAVGPVSVDLATGNLTTSAKTHSIAALGGSLGVGLDYNSPQRSRPGLVGEYWDNVTNGVIPSTAATITKVDPNIDFEWGSNSPYVGVIGTDWFVARWSGYITVPTTGSYQFGSTSDDGFKIYINDQLVTNNVGCCSNKAYGSSVTLTGGQPTKIRIEYNEANGGAYAHLYIKGAVSEQVVPNEWLQTGVRPIATPHGLVGRYYAGSTLPTSSSDATNAFLVRTDTSPSLDWGTGSPVPNGPADNFVVRWTGFFKAPQGGDYKFGGRADDGIRIIVNGNTQLDTWSIGATSTVGWAGGTVHFNSAGDTLPITVEYKEVGGGANLGLYVDGPGIDKGLPLPSNWLVPQTQVLPDGWSLGMDADGNLGYDSAVIGQNGVTLRDSTGQTHEYKWTGSGYTPPVGEAGHMLRNGDGTVTLQDEDGRTYVFNPDGSLKSSSTPTDDLHPAALQYTYSGSPSRLTQITDATSVNRWAKVLYSGDASCPLLPGGFIATPSGMICAVTTSDGSATNFFYTNDTAGHARLGRLELPGSEVTDYGYLTEDPASPNSCPGCLASLRDSMANDAISKQVRTQDNTLMTEIAYDAIGRVSSITMPAANAGDTRQGHTYEYQVGMPTSSIQVYRYVNGSDHAFWTTPLRGGYWIEGGMGYLSTVQQPNSHMLYSCLNAGWDEFTSAFSNCEGQVVLGQIGFIYDTLPSGVSGAPIYRCTVGSDHFDSNASNCEGQHFESFQGYATSGIISATPAFTKVHITGATEPGGFSRKVLYDTAYRTTADTDVAGLTTNTEWDVDSFGNPRKDMTLSSTDPVGLKTTTIYDYDDRPTDQYGPAPFGMFGADRKPLAGNDTQVPHTQTGYDESINGLATSYYNVTTSSTGTGSATSLLVGSPKAHATGVGLASGDINQTWTTPPITPDPGNGWGARLSGDLHLTATGTYSFLINSNDGVRLWIDDTLVVGDWTDSASVHNHPDRTIYNASDSWHRIRLDYYSQPNAPASTLQLYMTPPNGTQAILPGNLLKPHYGLTTSQKTYDASSAVGTVSSVTNYGANPELGLAQSSTLDANGLNYTSSSTYEAQGAAGSFLRQTSKTLPGGATTTYAYYNGGSTTTGGETRANPCDINSPAVDQGGQIKLKTEPDPDGTGPLTGRTTETVYDAAGRVLATRYNADPWTCTSYDSRGRVTQVQIPSVNGQPARTVTNNYTVGNNPFVVSTTDSSGTISTTSDLLGRTVSYTDANGQTTTTNYDTLGRLSGRSGPLGTEAFVYDTYNRLTSQKLDGTVIASPTYDAYGRLSNVTYPTAGSQALAISRDSFGRTTGMDYTLGNGTTHLADTVTRSQSGQIISGTELGLSKSYTYDLAGRLTASTIGSNTWNYGFGTPTACTGTYNPNAGKNSNRTSQTKNGATTTYCYDTADRLISSSDAKVDAAQYDAHGNTTQLGTSPVTTFGYDSSDRNTSITEGSKSVTYARDVQGRVTSRSYNDGTTTTTNKYAFTGAGDTPDLLLDNSNNVVERYLQLPGGVLLTKRSSTSVFSLVNVHGDTMATTDASGTQTGTFTYDPFGQVLGSTANNTAAGSTYGWVGQHEKDSETVFALAPTEMGARVYLASIGRFLQVDPVEGGTPNNYVYPPNPVNAFDLDGNMSWSAVGHWAWNNSSTILAVAGFGACIIATAGVCTGVAIATAVAGGAITATKSRQEGHSWGRALSEGGLDAGIGLIGARKVTAVRWFGAGRNYKTVALALTKIAGQKRLVTLAKDLVKDHIRGKAIDRGWRYMNTRWR